MSNLQSKSKLKSPVPHMRVLDNAVLSSKRCPQVSGQSREKRSDATRPPAATKER